MKKSRDSRRQNYEALEKTLASTFKTKTRGDWLKILEAHDVPAVPLYDVAEVLDDPQVKHLGLIEEIEHPTAAKARTGPHGGEEEIEHPTAGRLRFVGGPVDFDNLAKDKAAPPPLVGAQSENILRALGHDDAAIKELVSQGVSQIAR